MLKIFPHDANDFTKGASAILHEASNVKLTKEINGEYTLEFDYPYTSDKAKEIEENKIAVCEGQAYRIMKISRDDTGSEIMHVSCAHIFHADLKRVHIQNFGGDEETIGANPYDVINLAAKYSHFSQFTESEIKSMGMVPIGDDGFLIDFESIDKTTPYDVIQQVITNCGKGELYIDNFKFALVERIGTDKNVRLDISKNMKSVSIERDITNMITRLYPYGKDDAHIGSINGNIQFVDSENISVYGKKEGYKDYSDYTDPETIKEHALWEFSKDNEDRIDVPDISITGSVIDLSKLSKSGMEPLELGDRVFIKDHGNEISERVIKIETYPYEPLETTVSIGRIKKDLFFYLNQMGLTTKRYTKNSTSNGKVSAQAISGTVKVSGAADSAGAVATTGSGGVFLNISNGLIKVTKSAAAKAYIGAKNGDFCFDVYDNRETPKKALSVSTGGLTVYAKSISVDGVSLTADTDNNLYINGKKILTEG